ncbi:MAG: hypothetical protein ABI651_17860 [Verrucomicrobiota bacterium]
MLTSAEQLERAIAQMGRMQRILESYRANILPRNSPTFAVFAEGPLDGIRKLQAEMSKYVVHSEQRAATKGSKMTNDICFRIKWVDKSFLPPCPCLISPDEAVKVLFASFSDRFQHI